MAKILGITLPIERGANGYFTSTSELEKQVRANITNLLLTIKGERMMQPEFGSGLMALLFEQEIDSIDGEIQTTVEEAVEQWMPYIAVGDIVVTRDAESNKVNVLIPYTILTNNITDSVTLVF
jgi:phage baseplate assembly protein W